jgi:multisubunit Na+/H+ antiporter MnhE subunit
VALFIIGIAYAAIIACLFRDYVTVIFPDFVKLYIPVQRSLIVGKKLVYGVILLAFLKWGLKPVNENIRRAVNGCIVGAMLSGLLFLMQGKGNYYHEIPFLFFYFSGAALALHDILRSPLRSSGAGLFATFVLLVAFSCLHAPVLFGFPTHADYRKLVLTQVADEAGPGKTFFVVGEGMEMIHQAAIYSGHVHASRFPDLWFLTGLLSGWGKEGDNARYADYVAADIHRYKPAVMAILHGRDYFDVVPWLTMYSPALREEMTHYIKLGPRVDNRRSYFRGATLDYDHFVTYDIYKRAP